MTISRRRLLTASENLSTTCINIVKLLISNKQNVLHELNLFLNCLAKLAMRIKHCHLLIRYRCNISILQGIFRTAPVKVPSSEIGLCGVCLALYFVAVSNDTMV